MKWFNAPRLSIHFAAVLAGGSGVFGKLIVLSPLLIVFGRALIAALALGAVMAVYDRHMLRGLRGHFGKLSLSGVLLAAHWVTFFQSIAVSTVAIGVLAFSLFPVFVTLFEHLITRSKVAFHDIFIAALAVVGVALTTGGEAFQASAVTGMAWGILSGFFYALNMLLNRYKFRALPARGIALVQFSAAALVLTPFALFAYTPPTQSDLMLIVCLGVVFTAVLHLLVIQAVKTIRAHTASVVLVLEPVYGIAFAVLLVGERISLLTLAGGAMIVIAALAAR